ncbi:MAG: sigma-70 family RNA polymerase sigma factor [Sedimentisphaerales bacterium]|nr:sigma-70 family RNA polymerase sigma factor [Sedimentisphaerales bacterium]
MEPPTDNLAQRVLIVRCQLRDRQALAELIERYERPLRYFIRQLAGDADLAEEMFQDTWLTVIRRIHTLADPEKFAVWLYRITRNRVYAEFRRRKQTVEISETLEADDDPQSEALCFDDAAKLHRCLGELKPLHKEVLLLRFLEEMSYDQIAQVLDCHLGTVRSRLHHAKRALREKWEERP